MRLRGPVFERGNASVARRLKLGIDLARGVVSVLPMRLYNARGLVRPTPPMNLNTTLQIAAVHATRESNFEVAVYLKMTRKKNTEKSRTSRHADVLLEESSVQPPKARCP